MIDFDTVFITLGVQIRVLRQQVRDLKDSTKEEIAVRLAQSTPVSSEASLVVEEHPAKRVRLEGKGLEVEEE